MGLLVLAASRATIWKTACVSHLYASDNSESKINMIRLVLRNDDSVKAIMIWVPYTNTNGQWIVSKLLQGFFGAPVESLCEISVTDIACHSARTLLGTLSDFFSISLTKEGLT